MWYRNKSTRVLWDVDEVLAKRLSADPDYEACIAPSTPQAPNAENKDGGSQESVPEETADAMPTESRIKSLNKGELTALSEQWGVVVDPNMKNGEIAGLLLAKRAAMIEESEEMREGA